MAFPDDLSRHGRTMLTSEGTVNRCSHIIQDETKKFRILTPLEAERMQGFDDNWTNTGMSERMRYFCMGPFELVFPIYIPGRTRTASKPSRISISLPE